MKKIILGKGLEERMTRCNFCGEYDKECVKGSVPLKVEIPISKWAYSCTDYSHKWVIEDYKLPMFGKSKKIVGEPKYMKIPNDRLTYSQVLTSESITETYNRR